MVDDARARLSIPDSEFLEWRAKALNNKPTGQESTPDIVAVRELHEEAVRVANEHRKTMLPSDSEYRVEHHTVPVENGFITVRCIIPVSKDGAEGTFPVLVHFHGGGWIYGSIESDDVLLKYVSVSHRVSVVNVSYRLAPEHPYPTPNKDCYAAVKWAADNTTLLGADLKKGFIVSGLSAGGNAAAVIARWARDDPFFKDRPLTGQIIQIPALLSHYNVPEKYKAEVSACREEFKDSEFLGLKDLNLIGMVYKPVKDDPNAWPLLHSEHSNLPPAALQVCGMDILRDDGLVYERELRAAGVKTQLFVYPGVPHWFEMISPNITLARRWVDDYKKSVQWLLDGAV
ncbi:hypothetical protein DENSPDRAFT_842073 [Dentipellis sp. KUC8613]|nr:hypothetical protein DENSPDRAFT_842073 [Dentipellis sp. KUC8613]